MIIRFFGCFDKFDDISYLQVCVSISELPHLSHGSRCAPVVLVVNSNSPGPYPWRVTVIRAVLEVIFKFISYVDCSFLSLFSLSLSLEFSRPVFLEILSLDLGRMQQIFFF